MANITASMVKELREKTSAGMLDCKKALDACDGDMEKAVTWLRERGIAKAVKKEGAVAAEGLCSYAISGNKCVVFELNSQTDFVAQNEKFINLLENDGKHLVVIGNHKSEWSKYYVEELDKVIEVSDIKNVYHYDINNDKAQLNSNYYAIVNLLKGSLVTTDGTDSNLLAPSFYIIKDGKVLYYNTDTVAMKNTEKPSKYWTEEEKQEFNTEITNAINKYYLNNK